METKMLEHVITRMKQDQLVSKIECQKKEDAVR